MAENRGPFERELKQKLSQRVTGRLTEESILLKSFKYFDMDNSGTLSFEEWTKALEKVGMTYQDPKRLQELFNIYDVDSNGTLDYKEFSAVLFGEQKLRQKAAAPQGLTPAQLEQGERAIIKLRNKLAERGGRGIIGLQRQFKIMDDDNSKNLDFQEFTKAMKDFAVDLSDAEIQSLFGYIDRNRSGNIDYDEFLRAVRGPMNEFRTALVTRAFSKIDTDHSGVLDINDIRGTYSARNHPDVKAGKKSEDQVLGEFLETFEMHHNIGGGQNDQKITREEFQEYYNNISMSIDNDQYFELMMTNTWKLNETAAPREERKEETKGEARYQGPTRESAAIFEAFRAKLAARGTRGIIGIQRTFKIIDDDNSKTLSRAEFTKGIHDFRVSISDEEITILFNGIDRDRSGTVDFDELIRAIRGPLNDFRKNIVNQAWTKLDRDGSGVVDITDLRGVYDARGHPDVKSGKKTEDQVLGEFLETFETHHNISDLSQRDQRVTKQEFEEYYANVSASIDNDQYFELMMNNAWKLQGEPDKKEAWASQDFSYGSRRKYQQAQSPFGTTEQAIDYGSRSSIRNTANQTVDGLIEQLRVKLNARGGARGFVGIAKLFKIMDDDGSGNLSLEEFTKAMKDFRTGFSDDDSRRLFTFFDADRSGSIDYEEFVHRVRGEMNNFRKHIVTQCFNKLDKNGNGIVEIDDIRGVYNATNHPDVRSGKKTEDDILCEFLDTFEAHHASFKEDTRDHRITLEEFTEYYNHVSASIDDDRYFDLMMKNAWNTDPQPTQKAWAGEVGGSPTRRHK
ncbi:unnamed protein product [Blepharisma stoltei]|uniref:EF-hand domain-containing protein n=1 Tax=Blepharisma stoltei TaxID=1481888 RepID=A0AAU9IIJ9_9CILI|nr:unnamed protein product [Blepharisma stoltei]